MPVSAKIPASIIAPTPIIVTENTDVSGERCISLLLWGSDTAAIEGAASMAFDNLGDYGRLQPAQAPDPIECRFWEAAPQSVHGIPSPLIHWEIRLP